MLSDSADSILRKIFQRYDSKGDGQLSFDEFQSAIKDAGLPEQDCRNLFDAVDLDGTGKIRYTEFLAATIEAQGAISEERLAEAFDRIDADDSGYISKENLRAMLGEELPQEEIDAIVSLSHLKKPCMSGAPLLLFWLLTFGLPNYRLTKVT